jgi:hypothetical protein
MSGRLGSATQQGGLHASAPICQAGPDRTVGKCYTHPGGLRGGDSTIDDGKKQKRPGILFCPAAAHLWKACTCVLSGRTLDTARQTYRVCTLTLETHECIRIVLNVIRDGDGAGGRSALQKGGCHVAHSVTAF